MRAPRAVYASSLLLSIVVGVLLVGATLQREFGHFNLKDNDFFVYYLAAQTIHDEPQGDIYFSALDGNPLARFAPAGSPLFQRAERSGIKNVLLYLYPPLTADMLVPISQLPVHTAATVWRMINFGLIFFSLLLLARLFGIAVPSAGFLVLVTSAFCFFPFVEALAVGQITIFLFTLWTIAVVAYSEGLLVLSACAFALATVLKVTPLMVVPLFFIWKEFRWLAAYASVCSLLVIAMGLYNGWHMLDVAARVLTAMGGAVPVLQNKCISSLLAGVYYGSYLHETTGADPRGLSVMAKLLSMGFYATCLFLIWRRRGQSDRMRRTITLAVFALVTVLCSPVAWRHAYTIAFIPISLLWVRALREKVATRRTYLLAFTSVAIGTVFFDLLAQGPLPAPLRVVAGGVWTLSCLALCLEVLARGFGDGGLRADGVEGWV